MVSINNLRISCGFCMTQDEARQQFREIIQCEDSVLALDHAALLIAAEDYPNLAIEDYLSQLDTLAEESRQRMTETELHHPLDCTTVLAAHLFYEGRFNGNAGNYYDARNSFLNEVIDRGKGIPITLSVIFIEVAKRLGVELFGVGMPGHFIVKYADEGQEVFFDPFNGGKILTEDDCRQKIEAMYNDQVKFNSSFLQACTKKEILSRMLQNLKGVYFNASDMNKALGVIERLLLINPDAMIELRDRGLVCFTLKKYSQARVDLEAYLKAGPQVEDRDRIKEVLNDLRQRQARLN